jgi:hypothetical protein
MTRRDLPGWGIAEGACGALAALLGVAGLAVALFADTMTSVGASAGSVAVCSRAPCAQATVAPRAETVVSHSSIAAGGISGPLQVVIAVVLLVLLAIAVGAIMHAFSHRRPWLVLLCLGTAMMVGVTVITGFSIGFLFAPADALAVTAVALALAWPAVRSVGTDGIPGVIRDDLRNHGRSHQ